MSLRDRLLDSWKSPTLLTAILWPVALVYRVLFVLNRSLYRLGIKTCYRAPVPVIVVGNITVGGTGKTPMVIALVEFLKNEGYRPGVVSRGYGGRADSYPLDVNTNTDAKLCGDEPLLIARRTQAPLCVAPVRRDAIELLMQKYEVNVVVSDDGLQHFAMQRDIEVCIVDETTHANNRFLLPAGPYREPLDRLSEVDLVVRHAVSSDGVQGFVMQLEAGEPVPVRVDNLSQFDPNKPVAAMAGIGNPQRFFDTCRRLSLNFSSHSFPDHHRYSASDLVFPEQQVLMTEKDAVKCLDLADDRHWYLPVSAKLDPQFFATLLSHPSLSQSEYGH